MPSRTAATMPPLSRTTTAPIACPTEHDASEPSAGSKRWMVPGCASTKRSSRALSSQLGLSPISVCACTATRTELPSIIVPPRFASMLSRSLSRDGTPAAVFLEREHELVAVNRNRDQPPFGSTREPRLHALDRPATRPREHRGSRVEGLELHQDQPRRRQEDELAGKPTGERLGDRRPDEL